MSAYRFVHLVAQSLISSAVTEAGSFAIQRFVSVVRSCEAGSPLLTSASRTPSNVQVHLTHGRKHKSWQKAQINTCDTSCGCVPCPPGPITCDECHCRCGSEKLDEVGELAPGHVKPNLAVSDGETPAVDRAAYQILENSNTLIAMQRRMWQTQPPNS